MKLTSNNHAHIDQNYTTKAQPKGFTNQLLVDYTKGSDKIKLLPKKVRKTKDFMKINVKNLSRVSKINMRRFNQKEDDEYILETPVTKASSTKQRSERPKSNFTYSRKDRIPIDVASTTTNKDFVVNYKTSNRPTTAVVSMRSKSKIGSKFSLINNR